MSFGKMFLIGGLEFVYLVAILLNATAFINVSWFWLFAPIWLPAGVVLLLMIHLFFALVIVAIIQVFVNRFKNLSIR